MAFVKAVREKVNAKVMFTSPSGGGKSMSMLELATGLVRKTGGRIAYIGTEGDRDRLYAGKKSPHGEYEYDYDLLQLTEFSPEAYIAAIDEAVDAGYKVIIIDGVANEWKFINDLHDRMPGNSFTNWSKLKPRHRTLPDKILSTPAHIIFGARGKDEWVLEEKNGKQVPKKVGMGSQTDKDMAYEVMLSLQIDQDTHISHADKDNTGLWGVDRYSIVTAKDGEALYDWCESGVVPTPKAPPVQKSEDIAMSSEDELVYYKKEIVAKAKALGGSRNPKVKEVSDSFNGVNPNKIEDINELKKYLEALNNIEE